MKGKASAANLEDLAAEGKIMHEQVNLNLRLVAPFFHEQTTKAYEDGVADGFFIGVGNHQAMDLMYDNWEQLKKRGIYEKALLYAFSGTRTNWHRRDYHMLRLMFVSADREKLRLAGSPAPASDFVQVYRGVSGNGRARRIRGLSWTLSLDLACWFAARWSLPHPAVFTARIRPLDAFAWLLGDDGRNEEEAIIEVARPMRLTLTAAKISAGAERWERVKSEAGAIGEGNGRGRDALNRLGRCTGRGRGHDMAADLGAVQRRCLAALKRAGEATAAELAELVTGRKRTGKATGPKATRWWVAALPEDLKAPAGLP